MDQAVLRSRNIAASRRYVLLAALLGLAVLAQSLMGWNSPDLIKYGAFLAIALFSSGARILVPGITGTLSISFLFVLVGLVELSPSETVLLAALTGLVQALWR